MLLEREPYLERLAGLIEAPGGRVGRVVLIRGEAGIGKSSLVEAFRRRAIETTRWYLGYCDDLRTPQPFAPFWDLASGAPEVAEALRRESRQEVFEAVFGLLDTPGPPGVIALEDTHWSDEATLDAIRYIGRRVTRTTGLLVLTYRTGEVGEDHPLRSVVGDLPSEAVLRLEPALLSREAVARIVADAGLDPDRVMEVTHGNPFLVTELAAAGSEIVPESVRDSVTARVDRLTPASRALVRDLSVIPGHVDIEEVVTLTGAAVEELAECERMGLIDVDRDRVSFRHDLIRRAIESTLTISKSVDTHRRVLDLLPDDSDPARLVHHAQGANDVDRFVPLAVLAARRAAAVSSIREAASHYRSLELHLAVLPPETRGEVLVEWAAIENYMESDRGPSLLDQALELMRGRVGRRELARALVEGVSIKRARGLFHEAHVHVDDAIALLGDMAPTPELAAALAAKSWLLIHQGDIVEAEELAGKAIETAEATGNEVAGLSAGAVRGTLAYVRGQAGGLDQMERVRGRARAAGRHVVEVETLLQIGRVAIEIRDLARAEDYGHQAGSTAARFELSHLETESAVIVTEAQLGAGEWAAAEDGAVEAIGRHPVSDVRFERVLGVLGLRTGRDDADAHLSRAWSLAEASGEIDHLLEVGAALVESMWVKSRLDAELLARAPALVLRGIDDEYPWPAGWLAFWVWAVESLPEIPGGLPAPWVDLMSGRVEEAAGFWAMRSYPYEQAMCLAFGTADQQLESIDMLEGLGASAVASKLRLDLRRAGISVPRGRGRATRSHQAGLTGRQAEVLELLGEGLSNPEIADRLFVSKRTVENHVSAILSKLGATDRGEAVSEARRRGLLVPQI